MVLRNLHAGNLPDIPPTIDETGISPQSIILKIHVYVGAEDQLVGGRKHVKKVEMLLMEKYIINKGHSFPLH